MNAKDEQIGGDHYKGMPIQPVEFIMANNIGYMEGCAIKYICRHGRKPGVSGKVDLEKAIHYLTLLKEEKYPEPQLTEKSQFTPVNPPPYHGCSVCGSILYQHNETGVISCLKCQPPKP